METPRTGSPLSSSTPEELLDHRNQPHSLPPANVEADGEATTNDGGPAGEHRVSMEGVPRGAQAVRSEGPSNVVDYAANRRQSLMVPNAPSPPGRPFNTHSSRSPRMRSIHRPSNATTDTEDCPVLPPSSMAPLDLLQDHRDSGRGRSGMAPRSRRNTAGTVASRDTASSVSVPEEVEEDVCFPQSDVGPASAAGIDFEEMEEFTNELERSRSRRPTARKHSIASTFKGRLFDPHEVGNVPEQAIDDDEDEDDTRDSSSDSIAEKKRKHRYEHPYTRPINELCSQRFSFFSSDVAGTVHADEFSDLLVEGQTFGDLFKEDSTWWLDCLNPTDGEMRMLAKSFGIHPLTAEDIRVQETREKVELFRKYYFVCFRSFQQIVGAGDFMEPVNIYIIVFRKGVLSFHFSPSPHSNNVRRRIRQLRDYVTLSPDWICYALIDDITDSFGPVINEIEKETDAIEDSVFVARDSDFSELLRRIGRVRKTVMGLMRLLGGKADVIKMFAKRCNEQWDVAPKGEIGLYLGDIQDHIVTMSQNLAHYEKILSRSHANHLAQLSVDNIATNNRVNKVLGKITLIGTILIPLNLVTGLWGMNVPVPGKDAVGLNWWFGILGCMVAVAVLAFLISRRWLLRASRPVYSF